MACFLSSIHPSCHRPPFSPLSKCGFRASHPAHTSKFRRSIVRASIDMSPEARQVISADENDVLLGEMRFSEPDSLPGIVEANIGLLRKQGDHSFWNHIEQKINDEEEMEEKETLGVLRDAVKDLVEKIGDKIEEKSGKDNGASKTTEEDRGYLDLLDEFMKGGDASLSVNVEKGYDRIDMKFLNLLEAEERKRTGEEKKAVTRVKEEVVKVMARRMGLAGERIKKVFAAKGLIAMTIEIEKLGREGGLDDAFMLMLRANLDQAKKAKADKFITVLEELLKRVQEVKDREVSPEVTLIRQLLRTESKDARKEILTEALTPRKKVMMVTGEMSSGVKTDGKLFVQALRKLIEEFGNVQEGFVKKLSKIGEESEEVAREIFALHNKDVKEVQDEAFHKRSVSVWELESLEFSEQMQGREAPWETPQPPGFKDGVREI